MDLDEIIALPDSHEKTAALVAWVQQLYSGESSIPVLVGGAAVELLTGGGYTTGDLDFVGAVPPSAQRSLTAAGFERKGRHWIHSDGQIFLEFPSDQLERDEESVDLEVAGHRVEVLAPEPLIVDRLAAWEFWNSSTDAVNAFLLVKAVGDKLDGEKLELIAERRELVQALERLLAFASRFEATEPTPEELAVWAAREGS
ncbi:MAG: hypothetical protein ACE5GX_19900 [Thermoanaerobaculia bacterium]